MNRNYKHGHSQQFPLLDRRLKLERCINNEDLDSLIESCKKASEQKSARRDVDLTEPDHVYSDLSSRGLESQRKEVPHGLQTK